MLAASEKILELFAKDEFQTFLIEGWNGYGKTAYANNVIAEVNAKTDNGGNLVPNWDIDLFKQFLGFHPLRVLNRWEHLKERQKVFHWDDAGAWLHSLDFNDPLVKQVGKYLQTARTDWACIIFSCIDADDLAKKIRSFSSSIKIRITKEWTDDDQPWFRKASAKHYSKDWYGNIYWIDDWDEHFNCKMPNSFYDWYRPLRNKYAKMTKKLARIEAHKKAEIVRTLRDSEL